MQTYETLRSFIGLGGLLYFGAIFVIAVIYALRPSNRKTFDAAARIPLEED